MRIVEESNIRKLLKRGKSFDDLVDDEKMKILV